MTPMHSVYSQVRQQVLFQPHYCYFVLLICGCICGCAFLICLFLVLAEQALSLKHPLLKIRPLSEGSQKAKWKAMRRAGRKDQELHLAYVQEETSEMEIEN